MGVLEQHILGEALTALYIVHGQNLEHLYDQYGRDTVFSSKISSNFVLRINFFENYGYLFQSISTHEQIHRPQKFALHIH